jgi:heme exporter protein D
MEMSFWAMGGHAAFVWPSYVIGVGLLVGLAVLSWRGYTAARADVARLEAESPRRRRGAHAAPGAGTGT